MDAIDEKSGSDKTVKEFFDEWSIYNEILARNSMHHDEIYRAVEKFLAGRFGRRPFSFLDLGCGSALHLAAVLKNHAVARYVGYDLAEVALAHAGQNLAALACPLELNQGDLLDGLRGCGDRFDIILASFALHHLSAAAKAQFFHAAGTRVKPNGCLLLIDTLRDEGESRELYLERYCAWITARCPTLSAPAAETLCGHIRGCDFPASVAELDAMAADAGFQRGVEVSRFRWHHTLCYRLEPID